MDSGRSGRPRSRSGWFLAAGFLGLAIAIASIADMFSARPYDGITPLPYGREGIEVRATVPGSPAETAGIKAGECILGIGKRIVNTTSDASAELRRHRIGEKVSYLVRNAPCPSQPRPSPPASCVRCASSSPPSGSVEKPTSTPFVVGFLFFLIGLFVFVRVPRGALGPHLLPALRPLSDLLRVPAAARLVLVDRHLRAEHGHREPLPAASGLPPLLPRLPAAQAARLRQARRVDGGSAPRWKVRLQDFLSASPELLYLLYAIPPLRLPVRRAAPDPGRKSHGSLGRAAVLLDPARRLPRVRPDRPGALGVHAATDPRERRQAFHVFVGTILGTVPFVLFFIVLPSAFKIDEYAFYGIIPMILIPLTFAYAIVRFQMLNVRVIVRRTFLYAATTAVLLGLYALVVALAEPRLRELAALGVAALQLRLLPRRHFALRGPAAAAPGAARQALLPREVRLPGGAARDERGHHGRARPRPHRRLPDRQRLGHDAPGEGLDLAARPGGLARAPRPTRGPSFADGGVASCSEAGGQALGPGRDLVALRGPGERGVSRAAGAGRLPPARAARLPRAADGDPRPEGETLRRALRPR